MAENATEKILEIKVKYDDAIRKIAAYRTELDALKKEESAYKEELKKGKISLEAYNLKIAELKASSQQYTDAIRVLNKEIQNNRKQQTELEGSLTSLRAQLSNLTAEYDSLSEAERNASKGQTLKKSINDITDSLKGAEEETQRFYRNVGNYEESIKKAVSANVPFIGQIMDIQENAGGLKGAFNAATTAVKGFSKQLLALLANPIVATLSVISVVIMGVTKAINSSEEASNRWSIITAPLTKVLNGLLNVVQFLAGGILSVVEAGAKLNNWISTQLEKVPLLGKVFKDINDSNREAIELAKEKIAIQQQERKDEVQNAKDALAVSELRNKAKDKENYTDKERLEFVRQANKLEQEQADRNVELAERKLKALQIESEWAQNNKEANDELARLEAEVYKARKDQFDKTRELLEQENTIKAEIAAKDKTAAEEAKKQAEEYIRIVKERKDKETEAIRQAEDAMLALVKDGADKQRQQINISYSREIEDLKKKLLEEQNLTAKARDAILSTIKAKEQEQANELQKISDEQMIKDIENREKLISLQLESVKEGSEQEYQLKMNQLLAQQELELSNTENTEQMKIAIRAKYNKQLDDLVIARNEDIARKEQEAMKLRFETEIAALHGNEEEILRIKVEQRKAELDAIQQMEGESIEAFNLRKLEAENAYIDAKQELANKEVEIEQVKYEAMAQITGGLVTLTEQLGESNEGFAKLSKILALGEIAVNTGKAIAAGVAQAQSVPFPSNIAAIATTITTIMTNIATAIKTVKSAKFATGGLVTGPGTGTSDSIPAQLSNGESVMTARATELFAPILSSFNQMGGGVPINITASSNQTMGEDMLARAVAKGVQMMPNPVVSVTEINTVGKRVEVLENLGSL
nr:MAG TPA: Tail tape measure [Caudoviricetes sp.]